MKILDDFKLLKLAEKAKENVSQSLEEATAIFSNSLSPSDIALNIAVLSAQLVAPYDAISTLHPVYTLPLLVNRAAPTLNLEYGT
jgi:hypothetical protein